MTCLLGPLNGTNKLIYNGGIKMVAKNNRQLRFEKNSEKRQRFAIKKLSVGVASVLVGLAIYGGQTAHASTEDAPAQATGESQNASQPQATNSAVKAVALQNVGGGASQL